MELLFLLFRLKLWFRIVLAGSAAVLNDLKLHLAQLAHGAPMSKLLSEFQDRQPNSKKPKHYGYMVVVHALSNTISLAHFRSSQTQGVYA